MINDVMKYQNWAHVDDVPAPDEIMAMTTQVQLPPTPGDDESDSIAGVALLRADLAIVPSPGSV